MVYDWSMHADRVLQQLHRHEVRMLALEEQVIKLTKKLKEMEKNKNIPVQLQSLSSPGEKKND